MKLLPVDIIEYTKEPFPGLVTCMFTDALGKTWRIHEKASVIAARDITADTELPLQGHVAGEVVSQNADIVCFCTKSPWGVETQDGENTFYVHATQLIDHD